MPAMVTTRRHAGFTLIEVAVVMLVIVIILGMVTINLGGDDTATVRLEARRLALLLQTAHEEAILNGRIVAVALKEDGYTFLEVDSKGKFRPLEQDSVLRARPLPLGMVLSAVKIEGAPDDAEPRLLLFPTGELLPFSLTLSHGQARWQVIGEYNGEITTLAPPADESQRV
jgi:general secretion pathway protein H